MARWVAALAVASMLLAPMSASATSHSLSVAKQGFQQGTVTSSPAGIVCGGTCSNSFQEQCDASQVCAPQLVTLTSSVPTNFTLAWQGQTCQGAGESQTTQTCTVPANDTTITARYIDATAPAVALTNPTNGGPFKGIVQLAAAASDGQSGVTRVDFTVGATVVSSDTSTPYTFDLDTTTLPDGDVSIGVVAFNGDGQARTGNPLSVKVDNTPPALTITNGPNGETFGPGSTQTFNFAASDANSAATICSLDSESAYSECSGGASYTDQPEGVHTFRVIAVDGAGNQTLAARTFTVDRTGPTTTIVSGPGDFTTTPLTAALFTFAAGEPAAGYACRLYPSGGKAPAFGACSAPSAHSASGLKPGDYTFDVYATDAFGNAGPAASRHFSVVFVGPQRRVAGKLRSVFRVRGKLTTVRVLRMSGLLIGTRVSVRCQANGCPFHSRTVHAQHGRVALESLFRNRALRPGTTIEIRAVAAGLTGQVIRLQVRRGQQPRRTDLCLAPAASAPTHCG
jgi:hypothetical protein